MCVCVCVSRSRLLSLLLFISTAPPSTLKHRQSILRAVAREETSLCHLCFGVTRFSPLSTAISVLKKIGGAYHKENRFSLLAFWYYVFILKAFG